MPLPALVHWDRTRTALHQATRVLGAIRAALLEPDPNWLHAAMTPTAKGATTGVLKGLGELSLDFAGGKVIYRPVTGKPVEVPLAGYSQKTLTDKLLDTLREAGHEVVLDRDKLSGEEPLQPGERTSTDYLQVAWLIYGALDRLRDSLRGHRTPVVLWPHGFDLSFLWFATDKTTEKAPHMSFGFSPTSTGFPRPYLYSYPWPLPDRVTEVSLPRFTRWNTAHGWTGTITSYENLVNLDDPAGAVVDILKDIFARVSPLVR